MTKIGTLKELGVHPGDVVDRIGYEELGSSVVLSVECEICKLKCVHFEYVFELGSSEVFRLISRASHDRLKEQVEGWMNAIYGSKNGCVIDFKDTTHKLWRDMTPEEKGALLLADHEGKVIEFFACGRWREASDTHFGDNGTYRIKPERTKSEWSAWFTSKADGTTKLKLSECADVDRVALGGGPQFAYRVKKWVE